MNITPDEAKEALTAIQAMEQKTRRSIAAGGTPITLIVTSSIWMIGFICNQFIVGPILPYIWIGLSVVGSLVAVLLSRRIHHRMHSPSTTPMVKRVGLFWILLVVFAIITILIANPKDGKQTTILVILFYLIGQMAMGLPFSFSVAWWTLPVAGLALVGYFFFPVVFYLWMGALVGSAMIVLGVCIQRKW